MVPFQPFGELFRRQYPDVGAVLRTPMTALKSGAERRGVVGQKGCFQHVLTMLQLQIIMVDEAAVLAESVDVLISWDGLYL